MTWPAPAAHTPDAPQAQLFSHSGKVCGNDKINLPLGFGTIVYNGVTCPTTAGGALNIGLAVTLPSAVPSGTYDVKVSGTDQSGAALYCMDANFSL